MTNNYSRPDLIRRLTTLYGQVGPGSSYGPDSIYKWRRQVIEYMTDLLDSNDPRLKSFEKIRFVEREKYQTELTKAKVIVQEVLDAEKSSSSTIDRAPIIFDDTFIHPDLWLHLKSSFEDEAWDAIPNLTAVFVENWMRELALDPRNNSGRRLLGENLFGFMLGGDGDYKLGDPKQPGEQPGWNHLGAGFALALSNVDRHIISKRRDKKAYALGVAGLGSLILTQINYQHGHIPKGLFRKKLPTAERSMTSPPSSS